MLTAGKVSTGTRIVPDNDGAVDSVVILADKVEIPELFCGLFRPRMPESESYRFLVLQCHDHVQSFCAACFSVVRY